MNMRPAVSSVMFQIMIGRFVFSSNAECVLGKVQNEYGTACNVSHGDDNECVLGR